MKGKNGFNWIIGCLLAVLPVLNCAEAADGNLRVYASTFNKMADAIEPLNISGKQPVRIKKKVCLLGACATINVKVCDGNWRGKVRGMNFSISSTSGVSLAGKAEGTFTCGIDFPFNANISTHSSVLYSSAQKAIIVSTSSTSVRPQLNVLGVSVTLGTINIGPSFTLPPLPFSTSWFYFESAGGQEQLRATAHNVNLEVRDGYINIQSDINFW